LAFDGLALAALVLMTATPFSLAFLSFDAEFREFQTCKRNCLSASGDKVGNQHVFRVVGFPKTNIGTVT